MNTLYLFRFSHYCEKVAWADDLLATQCQRVYWLPGLHSKKAQSLSQQGQVPILKMGGKTESVVAGSAQIIHALQRQSAHYNLFPDDPQQVEQCQVITNSIDKLGPVIRGLLFDSLLREPAAAAQLWMDNQPLQRLLYPSFMRIAAPMLRKRITQNVPDVRLARKDVNDAMDGLMAGRKNLSYLVGDTFSIADLTVAAMLMPLCMPKETGYQFDPRLTGTLDSWLASWQHPVLDWVKEIYSTHRT